MELFNQLDRELWVITAAAGGRRGGLVATFVSNASIVPGMPRLLVGLAKQHHTWELVEEGGAFVAHVLGERHLEWVERFGLQSGRDADKLAGLATAAGVTGCPILTDAPSWLECRVEATLDTGDRTVYLAEVVGGGAAAREPLLTVTRLLQLAPPEWLGRMKAGLVRDAAVDAAAIARWRERHAGGSATGR